MAVFSPDGKQFALMDAGDVTILNTENSAVVSRCAARCCGITCVDLGHIFGQNLLVTVSGCGIVTIYKQLIKHDGFTFVQTWTAVETLTPGSIVLSVKFFSDGTNIALVTVGVRSHIFDLVSAGDVGKWTERSSQIVCDGKPSASALGVWRGMPLLIFSADGYLSVWSIGEKDRNQEQLALSQWSGARLLAVSSFANHQEMLFACTFDNTLNVIYILRIDTKKDLVMAKMLHHRKRPDPIVRAFAFSPHDTTLASGDALGAVHLWDTAKGTLLRSFPRERGFTIIRLKFAPNRMQLYVAGTRYIFVILKRAICRWSDKTNHFFDASVRNPVFVLMCVRERLLGDSRHLGIATIPPIEIWLIIFDYLVDLLSKCEQAEEE